MAVMHSRNRFAETIGGFCEKLYLSGEDFENYAAGAARELAENRSLYTFKVIALAVLGYAYIVLITGLLIALIVVLFGFLLHSHHLWALGQAKLILLLFVPLGLIFKSLWLKTPVPEGLPLTRKEAPILFKLLDELSGKLNTRVDKVLMVDDFNAAVVQIPRFGIFGFYQNYLLLGLPLMLTHRPEQFRAVLAHELGHLSSQHSRSGAWIYQIRGRWQQLLSMMQNANAMFYIVFVVFFSWFSPRFAAYSLALARKHELEADLEATRIAGVETFTASMLMLPVYEKILDEHFWTPTVRLMRSQAEPPSEVFAQLHLKTTNHQVNRETAKNAIRQALKIKDSGENTHPSLYTRLFKGYFEQPLKLEDDGNLPAALYDKLLQPIGPGESAAEYFLEGSLQKISSNVSNFWSVKTVPEWTAAHAVFKDVATRLDVLKDKETALSLSERKEKILLLKTLWEPGEDSSHIASAYEELMQIDGDDSDTQFRVSSFHLEEATHRLENEGHSAALEKIFDEHVARLFTLSEKQRNLWPRVYDLVMPALRKMDKQETIQALDAHLKDYGVEAEKAKIERLDVNARSILEPHEMTAEQIAEAIESWEHVTQIKEVWAVRKFVRYLPECPYLVVGLVIKPTTTGDAANQEITEIAMWAKGNLNFPFEYCLTTYDFGTGKLKQNMQSIDGSLIYRRQ